MGYKEVIKKMVYMAFNKAKKESLLVLKTPLSKHISYKIEKEYKTCISEKTFIRYYDKYIGGIDNATGEPNRYILDLLCKYIGYEDFVDFYNKEENEKIKKQVI